LNALPIYNVCVYITPYLVAQFGDLNSFSGVFTTFMGPWGLQKLGTERVDRGLLGGQRIQSLQGGNRAILGNRIQECDYV
jgi:hypothetical protein